LQGEKRVKRDEEKEIEEKKKGKTGSLAGC
jgi:hypothetical protein